MSSNKTNSSNVKTRTSRRARNEEPDPTVEPAPTSYLEAALSTERKEAALSPEEKEAALSPEEKEAALSPEEKEAALSPEEKKERADEARAVAAMSAPPRKISKKGQAQPEKMSSADKKRMREEKDCQDSQDEMDAMLKRMKEAAQNEIAAAQKAAEDEIAAAKKAAEDEMAAHEAQMAASMAAAKKAAEDEIAAKEAEMAASLAASLAAAIKSSQASNQNVQQSDGARPGAKKAKRPPKKAAVNGTGKVTEKDDVTVSLSNVKNVCRDAEILETHKTALNCTLDACMEKMHEHGVQKKAGTGVLEEFATKCNQTVESLGKTNLLGLFKDALRLCRKLQKLEKDSNESRRMMDEYMPEITPGRNVRVTCHTAICMVVRDVVNTTMRDLFAAMGGSFPPNPLSCSIKDADKCNGVLTKCTDETNTLHQQQIASNKKEALHPSVLTRTIVLEGKTVRLNSDTLAGLDYHKPETMTTAIKALTATLQGYLGLRVEDQAMANVTEKGLEAYVDWVVGMFESIVTIMRFVYTASVVLGEDTSAKIQMLSEQLQAAGKRTTTAAAALTKKEALETEVNTELSAFNSFPTVRAQLNKDDVPTIEGWRDVLIPAPGAVTDSLWKDMVDAKKKILTLRTSIAILTNQIKESASMINQMQTDDKDVNKQQPSNKPGKEDVIIQMILKAYEAFLVVKTVETLDSDTKTASTTMQVDNAHTKATLVAVLELKGVVTELPTTVVKTQAMECLEKLHISLRDTVEVRNTILGREGHENPNCRTGTKGENEKIVASIRATKALTKKYIESYFEPLKETATAAGESNNSAHVKYDLESRIALEKNKQNLLEVVVDAHNRTVAEVIALDANSAGIPLPPVDVTSTNATQPLLKQ